MDYTFRQNEKKDLLWLWITLCVLGVLGFTTLLFFWFGWFPALAFLFIGAVRMWSAWKGEF